VLSRDTGYTRDYDRTPYPGYRERSEIWFRTSYKETINDSYFEKELTVILNISNNIMLFPFKELSKNNTINLHEDNQYVVIVFDEPNKLVVIFNSTVDGQILSFNRYDGEGIEEMDTLSLPVFQDMQTRTIWNMRGEAIKGELIGHRLKQSASYNAFWFATVVFFPQGEIRSYSGQESTDTDLEARTTPMIPLIILLPLIIGTFYFQRRFKFKKKRNEGSLL
jgi:hypothetical protein